jgi:parvulin-like peptidyl-prolyl isomerase
MMKQMRENTKVILWIVVVAFVVTIFAVWGLDLQGGGAGGRQFNTLGKVNGIPITREQYQVMYEQLVSQMRQASPDGSLSFAQQEMVQDQVWENLITAILTDQEIEKLGIQVSDEEIVAFLRTSPPPEVQQYFVDENGRFDYQAYQSALNNPDADWTAVEALARRRIPLLKLNRYLMSQVHVGPADVQRVFEEDNVMITVQYVAFPLADEDVSDYNPTDEEIRGYYDMHAEDFRVGEQAVVEYIKVPIEPTAGDYDDVMYTINNLSDQLAEGEDFGALARTYSQAPTAAVDGETGLITAAQRDPAVMTQVAIMNEGQVSEPIPVEGGFQGDGVYLVQLIEKVTEDETTKYNLREIFIELTAGSSTVDSLSGIARDMQELAMEKDFATAAAELGLEVETTEPFQRNFPITPIGFSPSVNRFAFTGDPGSVSGVLTDEFNYYVCRLVERIPESIRPMEDVRTTIVSNLRSERQESMALRKAEAFWRKMFSTTVGLDRAAEEYGYTITSPDPFAVSDPIGDRIAPYSPLAYAALRMPIEEVSRPVRSRDAYYVFRVLERSELDREVFAQKAPEIADQVHQEKVQTFVTYWYAQLRENAEIEDYRQRY